MKISKKIMAIKFYKTWYIGTKKSDINIIANYSKRNASSWGIEKEKHGFTIGMGKFYIEYTKYPCEQIPKDLKV